MLFTTKLLTVSAHRWDGNKTALSNFLNTDDISLVDGTATVVLNDTKYEVPENHWILKLNGGFSLMHESDFLTMFSPLQENQCSI